MPTLLESFEDGDITEYGGDTASATVQTSTGVTDGSNALEISAGSFTIIADTGKTINVGETPFGCSVTHDIQDAGFGFGGQNENGAGGWSGYTVEYIDSIGDMQISKWESGSRTNLASQATSSIIPSTPRLTVSTWDADGNITFEIRDSTGSTLESLSTTDTTYGDGGIAFFGNGGFSTNNHYYDELTRPTRLSAPSNVSASVSQDDVTVSWDAADGAAEYDVLRAQSSGSTESDYAIIATVTDDGSASFSVTDTGLEDGEKFFYRVESVS